MTMREYLSDRLGMIVLQAVFAMAASGFLHVTGTGSGVILLLVLFWLLVCVCACMAGFLKCRGRLRELENIMESLDKKFLFAECIPKGSSIYERKLLELFHRAGQAMIGAVSDAQAAQREYREYVESWVHEIKTPIAAAGLICHNADPVTRRKLSPEMAQIEAHVERALFYARAESPEKDFMIRKVRLSEIVDMALERHRMLLIQSGIALDVREEDADRKKAVKERVELENALSRLFKTSTAEEDSDSDPDEGMEYAVYTDDKWAAFMLGQLLQNAARYRREDSGGTITLSARKLGQQVQLSVSDNGMGIPAHELPRIFERGFTGSNGRIRGGSTGMGLYLCRRLADCLEMELQITSGEGEGTTVTLTFPAFYSRGQ